MINPKSTKLKMLFYALNCSLSSARATLRA